MDYRGPYNPKNPPPDGEAGISIYLYRPWLGGAIAGVVTFGIAMLIQLWYARKRGTRWIHGLLAFGCVSMMERGAVGIAVRSFRNGHDMNSKQRAACCVTEIVCHGYGLFS